MVDPDFVFAELADLATDVAREIRQHGRAKLTPTQIQVMRYVHRHPGITPSEIAAATELRRGNVSPVLTQLRGMGFVRDTPDPDDARSVRLTATPLADETLAALRASWAELIARCWPEDADARAVAQALRDLRAALAAERAREPDELP
ncbi:MarR family transcriptional regulator [Microbacterium sp. X-17]|uniref:MarR family winged helix-turn-helix transcriptional regulator n=1 Tax=Microbacterium sp. X-17 TaxID=3144404 RepID=UPI0031F53B00